MSSIKNMSIQGIRSFGPDDKDKQAITFFNPLTLILGPNGTGKTTIIECLKYITTGDMPPGSKGAAFIHDPKVAHEREVKGQVRLKFVDVSKKLCLVARSMVVTQKAKTLSFRTLDGVITRLSPEGEKISTTSRCVEIEREMISSLGVSKAVLENVIFCHQEEANWPLSEGKALKDKFDAIFASTRYVKALESIRKLKQSQDVLLREYKTEIKFLRQNKEKADELMGDLSETEAKFLASKVSVKQYDDQIQPLMDKLEKNYESSRNINKLSANIGKIVGEKEMLEKTIEELLTKIENEFQGSTEDLQQMLSEFQSKVEDTEDTVVQFEKKLTGLKRELDTANQERSRIDVDVGKLEQGAKVHGDNVQHRDDGVRRLAEEYGFEGFERGTITFDKYHQFEELMKEKLDSIAEECKQVKEDYVKKEMDLQRQIDRLRESRTKLEQNIKNKQETMRKNSLEVKDINKKLSEVDASAGRLDHVNRDMKRAEHDLKTTESSVNIEALKEEVRALQQEKQKLDAKLSALSAEMGRMHLESKLQTEVNLQKKEKSNKEESVRKIKAKHEDTLKYLLGHMPAQNVRGVLDEYTGRLGEDVKSLENAVQRRKLERSTKEANRKMIKEQLKKKDDELKALEEKIFDVCGSQNFEEGLVTLQEKMSYTQDQRGSLLGASHFFKKYTEDLRKDEPCCPLCHREFDGEQEVRELILELDQKLRMVPSKMKKAEKDLDEFQKKYDSLMQLKPLQANIHTLTETDIPELKTKLSRIGTEVDDLTTTIQDKEEDLQTKQADESMATGMTADIILMDRYLGEIRDLDRKITAQSAKLTGGGSDRSMQEVNNEKEEAQMQLETTNRQLDHKRDKISSQSEQIQTLKARVNELMAEKLRIEQDVQQRIKLEERKATLQSDNDGLDLDLQDEQDQLEPLKSQIQKQVDEKTKVSKKKDELVEAAREKGATMRTKAAEVHSLNKDIKLYLRDKKAEALAEKKRQQGDNTRRVEQLSRDQQEVHSNLDKLRKELATQQVRERELEDNLQLRAKQKEVGRLQHQIDELKEQIGGFDPANLDRQRTKLEDDRDKIRNTKHQMEGRQRGYLEQINKLKQDLQTDMYKGADVKYRDKNIALRTTELANKDLEKYYKALDRAIMSYHSMKMTEINKIIRELWRNTYRGNDIETIEIRSDEDESGQMKSRRVYNYRVVMIKGDADLDMRGRCSAGQKVLASLIIRLALAETFCLNCGILALDEPTTNLDRENIESLAYALVEIIKSRSEQRNFQLVVITHDEDFVELLGRSDYVEEYYKIGKNELGCSQIIKCRVADLHVHTR